MPKGQGGGRPKAIFPMEVVEAACQLNATSDQVLEILASQGHKISQDTMYREIKRKHGLSFAEFRDKKTDLTRLKLVQKAVKMALDGNATMLIFSLKNMCGWMDKIADDPVVKKYKDMSIPELIEHARKEIPELKAVK